MAGGRRVTINEVLRLSRRVFLALGVGPGCEREPAQAVTWLEARGLPGLATLAADLERLRGAAAQGLRIAAEEGAGPGELRVDAGAGATLWAASGAVDWLLSRPPGARVRIGNAFSPLWPVPLLAARSAERGFWLEARGPDAALQLVAHGTGDDALGVETSGSLQALAGAQTEVVIGTGPLPRPARLEAPAVTLDAVTLDSRHRDSLHHGLRADPEIWERLLALGRESLVPASQASLARGAGGGDDNA